MLIIDILKKIKFDVKADRIGPDIIFTYWMLFFKNKMKSLCKKKFKYFSDSSEFRPGAYAIGCSKIEIRERVIIRPGVMLFAESKTLNTSIIIEDDVMIGSGVHFYINNHKFDRFDKPIIDQGYYPDEMIILKKGCWIGANVILLPGVTIGRNSVVGAGSIVTKSVADGVVVAGNPARFLKNIFQ